MTVKELIDFLKVQDKEQEIYIDVFNRALPAKRVRNVLITGSNKKVTIIE